MNTRLLSQFVAVADTGTITAAARQLNIAQPALSHAIASLEKDLGVRLFERHRRGVVLTEAGSILFERARPILDSLEAARVAVKNVDPTPSGIVRIAMPASIAYVLAKPLLEVLENRYRKIQLLIEESLARNLPLRLRTGHADLIVQFDAKSDGEFHSEPIIREHLYLAGTGLGSQTSIAFKELQKYELFLPDPQHSIGRVITHYEKKLGLTLNRQPLISTIHPAIQLAEKGLGHAVVPWSIIFDRIGQRGFGAQRIVSPEISRTVYLVRRRSGPHTSAATAVMEAVLQSAARVHTEGKWQGDLLTGKTPLTNQ
jgi:LysR family nitrogen assimilation transcriptional regulator